MFSQPELLSILNRKSWVSTNRLCELTNDSKTSLTLKLGKLYEFGFVERKRKKDSLVFYWRKT